MDYRKRPRSHLPPDPHPIAYHIAESFTVGIAVLLGLAIVIFTLATQ